MAGFVPAAKVGSPNPPGPGRTVHQHRLHKMTSFKSLMESMESLSALMKDENVELDPKALFNATIQVYEKFMHLFKDGSPEVAALEAQEALASFENMVLNIAVTGETGAGKSSFINALRGLETEDKGAAPTGVTETTTEPTAYPHPTYPNVTLWDLPGIGAMDFRPKSHASLAREIQRMEKKFYFVRCKVDEDLANERRANPKIYSQDSVLQRIRENSEKHLRYQEVSNPQVFLLSNWKFDHYDFHLLEDTLEKDLPRLQKLTFLLSLPNLSPEIIGKKKATLKKHLWKTSLVSAYINAVPLERISLACDIGILLVSTIAFYKRFGLDDDSLA
ncbi:unnamed protein product [Natator depressus]